MKPSDELKKKYASDKESQTVAEIVTETGLSDNTVRRHARKMVQSGLWKETHKRQSNGAFTKAYLVIK